MHTKDESKRTSRFLNVEQFAKKVSLLARGEDRSEELKQQYRSDLEFAMRSMKTLADGRAHRSVRFKPKCER